MQILLEKASFVIPPKFPCAVLCSHTFPLPLLLIFSLPDSFAFSRMSHIWNSTIGDRFLSLYMVPVVYINMPFSFFNGLSNFTFMHWRRQWQPTPVFWPGESQRRGSLVGCHLWGRTESDTTEAT